MQSEIGGRGLADLIYNPHTGEYETYEQALNRKMNEMFGIERNTKD